MKKQRVTQKQIADQLGISRSTVSYVLAGRAKDLRIAPKTVEKIFALAGREGYIPNAMARNLSKKRSHTVGIIIDYLDENIAHHLHLGMLHLLRAEGLQPIFVTRERQPAQEEAMIQWLLERCVDALVIFLPMEENLDLYRNVERQGTPLLFAGDFPAQMPDSDYVVWDWREPVRDSVKHLVEQGCQRIGYFGHAEGGVLLAGAYQSYREALEEHGLPWNPEWTFQAQSTRYSKSVLYTRESENFLPWVQKTLVDRPPDNRPDGFLCGDDFVGIRLANQLPTIHLKLAQDVALVGRGNYPSVITDFQGLTSYIAPFVTMGKEIALAILEGQSSGSSKSVQKVLLCNEIVVRHSSMRKKRMPIMDTREYDILEQEGKIRLGKPLKLKEVDLDIAQVKSVV